MTNQPVFVYGILLSDATVGATLHGYKLESFGNLTVTESDGDHVLGGIVYADPMRMQTYDRIEGYRPDGSGYYRTETVEVDTLDGQTIHALVYVMNERSRHADPFGTGISEHHQWMRERELVRLGMMSAPRETIPAP